MYCQDYTKYLQWLWHVSKGILVQFWSPLKLRISLLFLYIVLVLSGIVLVQTSFGHLDLVKIFKVMLKSPKMTQLYFHVLNVS